MPIRLPLAGSPQVTAIKVGGVDIYQVKVGSNLVWTKAAIYDSFNGPDGFLQNGWVNEFATGDLGALISDGIGFLVDGLGNVVGTTVALVEGGVNGLGQLVSATSTSLVDAYCATWGGSAPPNGLIGLVNGIPIFGNLIGSLLGEWLEGDINIESIIGKLPIFGALAEQMGLIPGQDGSLADPINYVVDLFGNVIGTLTCGAFTLTGGSAENVSYVIGQQQGSAKMMIPDGLMNLDLRTSRFRWPTQTATDDGYVEVQVSDLGSPGFKSQVWRRWANTGGATGVGLEMLNSSVSIVRRVANTETLVMPNVASLAPADTLRLTQAGNLHTLTVNGGAPIVWNDAAASAAKGAANRSVAMVMQGAKERAGTRKFSPSFNYLEAA
jgi:hypothetical protein